MSPEFPRLDPIHLHSFLWFGSRTPPGMSNALTLSIGCWAEHKGNGQQGFPGKLIEGVTVPKLFQYLIKSRPLLSGSPADWAV